MADTAALKFHEARLTQKIADLKSGKLVATITEGDGRQEATIVRNEALLRQVKKDIAAQPKEAK